MQAEKNIILLQKEVYNAGDLSINTLAVSYEQNQTPVDTLI